MTPIEPEKKVITQEEYLNLLDRIWDTFDRLAVNFILLGHTAQEAWKREDFTGDIRIGIKLYDAQPRLLEFLKLMLDVELDPTSNKWQKFEIDGIEVSFKVPQNDYPILRNVQQWVYPAFPEILFLPNPMESLANYKML